MGILGRAAGATALAGLVMSGTALGAPVFSVPVPKAIPGLAQHLAAGDVTGDGIPDLVALSAPSSGGSHVIITLAGSGDGTFIRRTSTRIGAEFGSGIATVDLDDDGKLDLLVSITTGGGAGTAQVALLNDGTGRFRLAGRVYPHGNSSGLAVARFDGDRFPDVVSGDLGNSLNFFKGLGTGTFAAPVLIRPGLHPAQIIAADVNSDGRTDLVTEEQVTSPGASATIAVSFGHGDGTFAPETTVPGQPIATAFQYFPNLAVGDIDGDGTQDIVIPATSGVVAALGHGDGTFSPFTWIGQGTRFPVVTGDIDADGIDDVIFTRANRMVGILGGSFAPFQITTSPGGSLVVADFNRDSRPDIAFMTSMATGNPKIRSSAVAVTLNAPARPVVGGLVVPAAVRRGAAASVSFVLTEAATVSVTVSRNGKVVRSIRVPGRSGTNHKMIGATRTLRPGSYILGVRARNARGTTRVIRAILRVRLG